MNAPLESTGPLAGKVALVTGGARRVGAEIARTLHAAGAQVAVHYRRSSAEAAALVAALNGERSQSAAGFAADLLAIAQLPQLVDSVLGTFGRLDVLVNNASTFYPTPVGAIDEAAWEDLLGTNLKAPLFLSQAAAPALRTARGLIVNLADIHGRRPLRRHTAYSIAKAGVVMMTRSLARELAPEVRVNAIAPGPVMWPVSGADDALKAEIVARTALKRMGSPHDVALAARYFAVDAPFVTGQVLAVDGGRSLGG
ncbi:MAG: pteridine reductase [Steroidobacteraceae bacterium]